MSPRARQWYAWSASAVFVLISAILLLQALGFRWTRNGQLIKTGVISISSQPRSTIFLNGQRIGPTPRSIPRLNPGLYRLELRRDGYRSWSQVIQVKAGTARTLDNIRLYRDVWKSTSLSVPVGAEYISDAQRDHVFSFVTGPDGVLVQQLWPAGTGSWLLPDRPIDVVVSPHEQVAVFQTASGSAIVTLNQNNTPWVVDRLAQPNWDSTSDTALYAVQGTMIRRYDVVAKTSQDIEVGSSLTMIGSNMFGATQHEQTTDLWRRLSFGDQPATIVVTLPGHWDYIGQHGSYVMVRSTDFGLTYVYRYTSAGFTLVLNPSGVDETFFTNRNGTGPLLWQDAADVNSLSATDGVTLLTRGPNQIEVARWLVDDHIIFSADSSQLSIVSVSNKQGHGILSSYAVGAPLRVLAVNTNRRTAVILPTGSTAPMVVSW